MADGKTPERAGKREELNDDSLDLLQALDRLKATEAQKRQEPVSTPRFHELADDIVQQSRAIFSKAYRQEQLGDEIPTGDITLDDVSSKSAAPRDP